MAFLTDAALGAVISELLKAAIIFGKQSLKFKRHLKTLEETLDSVKTIFDNTQKLHIVLNRSKEETEQFTKLLRTGLDLVKKCSTIPCWNVYDTYIYSNKLVDLDNSILKFFHIEMQGLNFSSSLRTEVGVKDCNDKLDSILKILNSRDSGFSLWGSVPGVPDGVVGFDQPLKDLKEMLFKDKEIVKVISAPGGCGKTTLAKMLCHDPHIRDIFGENILFVPVSKSASITVIVEKIFKCRLPDGKLPDFQNDYDAINHLEYLLKQIGPSPILLVLDDVWPDWESLIDNLTFSLPNFKILVTSRFSFPRFSPVYNLKILNDEDAMTLFCRSALPPADGSSRIPSDLVEQTVKGCKGFPLALKVVGRSLYGRPEVTWRRKQKKWSDGKSVLDTDRELLDCLQTSLDALDEINDSSIKDCCLDLGSFPEDQRIPANTLMDMWAGLYNLDDEDMDTFSNLVELAFRNLVTLVCTRQTGNDVDGYCNENHVMQHDLLRDLVIHQSNREPLEDRQRLFIEITGNDFAKWTEETCQPIHARLLSISTDKNFSSSWLPLTLPAVEVVVLNCCSGLYTIPHFIKSMDRLKVLVVTNYGSSFSKLFNFHLLESLPFLRRIRLERVSLASLDTSVVEMVNLQKISFTMCEMGKAFENGSIDLPRVFPNLMEIEIDCCDDLVKLHVGLCEVVSLKKISITYCNELSALPEEIGRLTNLEVLRLNSCTKLLELPESIGNLHKLRVLDISDCLSISNLPRRVGELRALKTFHMRGCQGLADLRMVPPSVKDLTLLEKVICDEGASHLWESYRNQLKNLKVEEVKEDAFESLMRVISPIQHF